MRDEAAGDAETYPLIKHVVWIFYAFYFIFLEVPVS